MRDVSRYHRLVSAAHRRLAGAISTMVLLTAVAGVAPAWAIEGIALDQDRVLYGEEGSTHQLAEIAIDDNRVGASCTLQVHAENQFSVHPGNDLLITTGGVQSVIEDVEAEPDADRDLSAAIVLGSDLLVELRFGSHQVSSMGFDLSVECPDVAGVVVTAPPTTTCPDPTSTTESSTTESSTVSTTMPATPTTVAGECPEPPPISEVPIPVPVPTPSVPQPCNTGVDGNSGSGSDAGKDGATDGGNLTLGPDGCETTTTTAPTTVPPTTAAPTTPPTTAAAQATTTTTVVPVPTVKGLQIFRQLPQTPAAAPVQASPAYTG